MTDTTRRVLLRASAFGVLVAPFASVRTALAAVTTNLYTRSRFAPLLNCLAVSTAGWWLLRRRGLEVRMRFGTASSVGGVQAHAWLEHAGRPVSNERGLDERYVCFDAPIG